jgi:hypothetical protein
MNNADAHTKIAMASVYARTAMEELEIGNLLECYNSVQIAKRNLTEAAKLLIDIVAEAPEKEFAVEL